MVGIVGEGGINHYRETGFSFQGYVPDPALATRNTVVNFVHFRNVEGFLAKILDQRTVCPVKTIVFEAAIKDLIIQHVSGMSRGGRHVNATVCPLAIAHVRAFTGTDNEFLLSAECFAVVGGQNHMGLPGTAAPEEHQNGILTQLKGIRIGDGMSKFIHLPPGADIFRVGGDTSFDRIPEMSRHKNNDAPVVANK